MMRPGRTPGRRLVKLPFKLNRLANLNKLFRALRQPPARLFGIIERPVARIVANSGQVQRERVAAPV